MSKDLDVKAVYEFVLDDIQELEDGIAVQMKAIQALKEFADELFDDQDAIEVQGFNLTELSQIVENAAEMKEHFESVKDIIKGIAYVRHDIVLFEKERMDEIEAMIAAFGGVKDWS